MNALTKTESTALAPVAMASPGNTALILDPAHLHQMMAVAELMARGVSTVPRHLQKNSGDCLAVVMQATQWGMNPFAVAQKTHVVNGTLGYEAQLVNAVVTTMAPTKDRINYEWFGDWSKIMGKFEERTSKKKIDEDTGQPLKYRVPAWTIADEKDLGIKVWATMKGESEPRVLTLLLVQCRVRNSPLWADDPRQQIAYLAVKRWTRLHCPDVLLGVYTPDEIMESAPRDMGQADVVTSTPAVPDSLLSTAQAAADQGVAAYQKFWSATGAENRKTLAGEHTRLKGEATAVDAARTVDQPTAGEQAAATGEITLASVLDRINAAKNEDALNVAMDWANGLADPEEKKQAEARYEARLQELRA